jgi:hypothetical protein
MRFHNLKLVRGIKAVFHPSVDRLKVEKHAQTQGESIIYVPPAGPERNLASADAHFIRSFNVVKSRKQLPSF